MFVGRRDLLLLVRLLMPVKKSGAFAFVMKEHLTQELPRLLELAASKKGWNRPAKNCA
jgi:hypothetical protein